MHIVDRHSIRFFVTFATDIQFPIHFPEDDKRNENKCLNEGTSSRQDEIVNQSMLSLSS